MKATYHNRFCLRFLISLISLGLGACGATGPSGDSSGETVIVTGALACTADNDCDGDGVFTICDEDDGDAEAFELDPACDEDEDGFADSPCTTFEDLDGDASFGEAERAEYGINCDTCPDMYDPDQEDLDGDGVGDLCVAVDEGLAPDISLNALPPEDSDISDDPAEDAAVGSVEDESGDAQVEAANPDDPDGDGLGTAIDPDAETPNAWGYVDTEDYDDPGCVPEKSFKDYEYVRGTRGSAGPARPATFAPARKQKPEVSVTSAKDLAVPALDRVSGVTDGSFSTLPTYACVGASAESDFEFGIYIVSSSRINDNYGALRVIQDALDPRTQE